MDYFQGVVTEYLRAKRSVFVNTECLLQLDDGPKTLKDRHWYCDIVAADFSEKAVYLCEVTYSATMQSLISRLTAWRRHWPMLVSAIRRDCGIPSDWTVSPWVFIPAKYKDKFLERFQALNSPDNSSSEMPTPRITRLESTLPWEYLITWNRKVDALEDDA
jgi:hypothetical protein